MEIKSEGGSTVLISMSSELSDWVRSLCGERKSVTYFVEVAFFAIPGALRDSLRRL